MSDDCFFITDKLQTVKLLKTRWQGIECLHKAQTICFSSQFPLAYAKHNLPLIGSNLAFRITLFILCMEFLKIHITSTEIYRTNLSLYLSIFTIYLERISLSLSRVLSFFRDNATRSVRRKRQREKARARASAHLPRKNRVKARCPWRSL